MENKFFAEKYQIHKEIASGGMGTIYHATDTILGLDVAIKRLHPQYSADHAFTQRFRQEARTMSQLIHPNIIRFWSVEEKDGNLYIVMDYVPGKDLKHIINSRGPLPIHEVLQIGRQIIEGLAYAHYLKIVHRDIKPANILMDQKGIVKITDFGIAAARNASTLTLVGTVIGTPEYMAPEQAKTDAPGPHTDLYSTGILLYELLTGKTPYKGIPQMQVVSKLADDSDKPSFAFPAHIPRELQQLIINMTQKCVEDRLTDVLDILAVLNTDFPPSPVQEKELEQDETLIAPSKEHSRESLDSSDHTIQDSSIPNNTGNQPNIPPYLPSDNNNPKPPPKPSHIRTLLISAIGIVAIVTLMVWLIPPERQENDDSTQEETTGPVFPSENQITTVIDTSKEIYQNIDAAQDKMRQEFKSFSSAIDALHREIINKKKIPTTLQAHQWYEQTTEKVVALNREGRNLEESQKSLMDTNMKASTAFIQQGKILLLEDLSQDQQLQLRAAIDKLEKLHNTLRTTYSQQRETTQRQLSTLDLAVKKVGDRLAAIPPPPPKQPPDIGRKLTKLQGEIDPLNQGVEDMLNTFDDSIKNFTTHLSNLQIQIQQIGKDDSAHANNTQKLVDLDEKLQALQQEAQTAYTRQQTNQEQLKKTLLGAKQNYQSLSGISLDTAQKLQLGKLGKSLKKNQQRLNISPPDSWKKLQDLSMNTRALLATTKETLAKKTIAVTGTKRKLEGLVQKAIRLQTDIKGFRSQTDLQYQSLSRQITTVDTQIDLLKSQPHDETLMTTVAKIEESLGSLEETLPLHLAKSDQQFPTFVERQTAIQAKLNSLTSTPLAPSLDQPASQVQHMLTAIQQDLQNLKQVSWNDLSATLEATHRAFSKFTP